MPPRSRKRSTTSYSCGRHVLLVAFEHDQVVARRELLSVRDVVEVRVGDELRLLAGPVQPVQERQVIAVEARRRASGDVGAAEIDGAVRRAGVPRVSVAVAVHVLEVVRLPGVRRQHHEHAARLPEDDRAHDERGVADTAVGGRELDVVQPAGQIRHAEADRVRRVSPGRPIDHRRPFVDLDSGKLVVRVRDHLLRPRLEDAFRERLRIGRDVDLRDVPRQIVGLREAGVDALNAHDDPARVAPDERVGRAVDDAVARVVDGGELHQIGARIQVRAGRPGDRVATAAEFRSHVVERRGRLDRARHVHRHGRRLLERERDVRALPESVAVRADRREQVGVPRERRVAVVGVQLVELWRVCVDSQGGRREHA